jgi:hypothetical protein
MTQMAKPALTPADRVEIHELAARYGTLIDDRDWPGLSAVFTQDAVFVITGRPGAGAEDVRVEGLGALRAFMDQARHPLAHHVTNVFVDDGPVGPIMRSKVIATLPKNGAGSADYRDLLRRTPEGWRIAERVVRIRLPPRP